MRNFLSAVKRVAIAIGIHNRMVNDLRKKEQVVTSAWKAEQQNKNELHKLFISYRFQDEE